MAACLTQFSGRTIGWSPEIERFLTFLTSVGTSPNTIRAYARDVADLFEWTTAQERDWRELEVEDIATWVKWLRTPAAARGGVIAVLPMAAPALSMRTVRRKLAAVDSFYVFHARHDDSVRLCLTRWHPGRTAILQAVPGPRAERQLA